MHFYIRCITCYTLFTQWLVFRMILLSGVVEAIPGPDSLDFCTCNLNSITAHDFLRVSLIEAYNSVYTELGWESLSCRRWCRRFTLFFKIINNLTPVYTKNPIPPRQQSYYSLRNRDAIGRLIARKEKFKSSFYPHCLSEWNELDPKVRLVPSAAVF